MKTTLIATLVASSFVATAASAATLSLTDTVTLQTTNWTETLSVAQFDSSLGTLNSVMVTLSGAVQGEASAESLDAAAATVTLDLGADITASTSALGSIANVLPVVSSSENLTSFDGTIDFGGTSGFGTGIVGADDMDSATLFGLDMSEFVGAGFVSIVVSADGESDASGAGNLITQFATQAQAVVTVKYDYTEAVSAVPLPAGLLLMGTAFAGFGLMRRKG